MSGTKHVQNEQIISKIYPLHNFAKGFGLCKEKS